MVKSSVGHRVARIKKKEKDGELKFSGAQKFFQKHPHVEK